MNVILFGPPGAGKGTQSQFLLDNFNYFQLSTGDLLRNEIKANTHLGKTISEIISRGELVTDIIVNNLLENIISDEKYKNRIIFDGYPRNLNQAKNLDILLIKYKQKIGSIIYLNVKKDEIQKRILDRITCVKCSRTFSSKLNRQEILNHQCGKENLLKRSDDEFNIILKRYDTYMENTKPVLDHYSKHAKFNEIDGSLEIDQISSKIKQIIGV